MQPKRLTAMANQIARFFEHRGEEKAAADTADHLRKFWDPRMRREIIAHFMAGGEGLSPIAKKAVALLAGTTQTAQTPETVPVMAKGSDKVS
ncbi:MAG: formate dehydrogenase subunit delta [Acidobacteriia bacterium]|nr:formate dehydrogenase subunit delta [Methyloceanibacter sp.]MCL6490369.1 formate dehydrogenase subunit delta [Terriglobia bacterium]